MWEKTENEGTSRLHLIFWLEEDDLPTAFDQISVCSCQSYLSGKKSNLPPFIVFKAILKDAESINLQKHIL